MSGVAGEPPDISPRGDSAGFVRVTDGDILQLPDRRGNNRADTLHNVLREASIMLVFFKVGENSFLCVEGKAKINTAPQVLKSFEFNGTVPRSVLNITPHAVQMQRSWAFEAARLWDPDPNQKGKDFQFGAVLAQQVGEGIDPDAQQEDVRMQYSTKLY